MWKLEIVGFFDIFGQAKLFETVPISWYYDMISCLYKVDILEQNHRKKNNFFNNLFNRNINKSFVEKASTSLASVATVQRLQHFVSILHNCPPVSDIGLLAFLTTLPCSILTVARCLRVFLYVLPISNPPTTFQWDSDLGFDWAIP